MSSMIQKAVLLIVMMFSNLTALDLCKEHFSEISGSADYRERIDLGRIVGEFIYKENGMERKVPTTNIIIHYDSKGFAHMRPGGP
jgi:Bacterial toxin 50